MSTYNQNETDEMMELYESSARDIYIPPVEEAHKTSSTKLHESDPMSEYFSYGKQESKPEPQSEQTQMITEAQRVATRNTQLTEAINCLNSIGELFEDRRDVEYLKEICEAIDELKG